MSDRRTVNARPISYAEIEALALDQAPLKFEGFILEHSVRHGQTLTPVEFSAEKSRKGEVGKPLYRPVADTRPNAKVGDVRADPDDVVGYVLTLNYTSMFGTMSGFTLFSSVAAEDSALALRGYGGTIFEHRLRVFVADSHAEEMPLTPVFGSQVSVGMIIKGLDPEEVNRRAEAALLAEFGDAVGKLRKVNTRPVKDYRINIYTTGHKPLAYNVLSAEASYLNTGGAYQTEEAPPSEPTVVIENVE